MLKNSWHSKEVCIKIKEQRQVVGNNFSYEEAKKRGKKREKNLFDIQVKYISLKIKKKKKEKI